MPPTTDTTAFNEGLSAGDGTGRVSPFSTCEAPQYPPCDDDDDLFHAMGVGCGGDDVVSTRVNGSPEAFAVHEGAIGKLRTFGAQEGDKFVILSTGRADDFILPQEELARSQENCPEACPSTVMSSRRLFSPPDPIEVRMVSDDTTCFENPSLVSQGDCSNTLYNEWTAGEGAYDYADIRLRLKVPDTADAIRYSFAFFTSEYPLFTDHETPFNDMYVAWLESETWTGNISFDEEGNPISIGSVFLDYRDAKSNDCPNCNANELHGFSMQGHAGTKWLTTTASVQPGETIDLIFAIFDLTDPGFDSVVLIDDVSWTCTHAPPLTTPVL